MKLFRLNEAGIQQLKKHVGRWTYDFFITQGFKNARCFFNGKTMVTFNSFNMHKDQRWTPFRVEQTHINNLKGSNNRTFNMIILITH